MNHLELYKNIFNKQLVLYKNYSVIDKRVFSLVKQYLNNSLNITNLNDEITIVDENMLSQNEKDISFKLAHSKQNKSYIKLITKFNEYKYLVKNYEHLLQKHDAVYKLSQKDNHELDLLLYKLIFLLIELKVSLNMNLQDMSIVDINSYCECIAFDIINNNYETLSFNKHIDEKNIQLILK